MNKIHDKVSNIFKEHLQHHKKIYSFIIAAIIVIVCFLIWLLGTYPGQLARDSFFKTFNPIPEEHIIEVFNGSGKIKEYVGYYRIENYQGRIVLIDDKTGEKVEIYGNNSIIINTKNPGAEEEGE